MHIIITNVGQQLLNQECLAKSCLVWFVVEFDWFSSVGGRWMRIALRYFNFIILKVHINYEINYVLWDSRDFFRMIFI